MPSNLDCWRRPIIGGAKGLLVGDSSTASRAVRSLPRRARWRLACRSSPRAHSDEEVDASQAPRRQSRDHGRGGDRRKRCMAQLPGGLASVPANGSQKRKTARPEPRRSAVRRGAGVEIYLGSRRGSLAIGPRVARPFFRSAMPGHGEEAEALAVTSPSPW